MEQTLKLGVELVLDFPDSSRLWKVSSCSTGIYIGWVSRQGGDNRLMMHKISISCGIYAYCNQLIKACFSPDL